MDELLAELASAAFPLSPLARCMGHFADIAPRLRHLLERAAAGDALTEDEEALAFYGLHILAAGRDARSCRPLLRLLRRTPDDLEALLGDALTETLPRILIGLFDGDARGYFDLATDQSVDSQVRAGTLGALAFLTWEGRIGREQTIHFLDRFDRERSGGTSGAAWSGWRRAIALLGLRGLAPQVEAAHHDGRLDDDLDDGFWPVLLDAETAPQDAGRFTERKLGYIRDLVEALDWMADHRLALLRDQAMPENNTGFSPDDVYDDFDDDFDDDLDGFTEVAARPVTNRWRLIGRNAPCPCGSGRKAKKCCLESGAAA